MNQEQFSKSEIAHAAKILIVDDVKANTMLLEKMLHLYDFSATCTVTDSRTFFDHFQQFQPNLILLDLLMPHVDGFAILEWLQTENTGGILPVIVLTALNDQENRLKAFNLGAQDFISKPFDQLEVITRIRNLLQIKLLHDKVRESNIALERRVLERTKEIENLQKEIVDRLMRAAECRDQETGDHIIRIGMYVQALAVNVGYGEQEARLIGEASKMHDLGKVGIPDGILLKPGKLDEAEMELMKGHALKGAQILAESEHELLKTAEQIALTHHEKWDGSGYPNGLRGEEIPLVGRLTALGDVFDALIESRPYKRAWEFDKVVAYIEAQRGIHFDPAVVDAFVALKDTFKNIAFNRFPSIQS